ncbi:hypothetical protein FVE85_3761 [Porphyridium purpureum]|uniref:Uncharacterized protein n=1 Tax=Porphyridium purpureum TaxID=35688 RepID=A0A5J4YNN8_PORPP|nr:hypothetical protein FVE85_3761 [Porphyridium purpureum]|eukprot:POR6453..scf249_10
MIRFKAESENFRVVSSHGCLEKMESLEMEMNFTQENSAWVEAANQLHARIAGYKMMMAQVQEANRHLHEMMQVLLRQQTVVSGSGDNDRAVGTLIGRSLRKFDGQRDKLVVNEWLMRMKSDLDICMPAGALDSQKVIVASRFFERDAALLWAALEDVTDAELNTIFTLGLKEKLRIEVARQDTRLLEESLKVALAAEQVAKFGGDMSQVIKNSSSTHSRAFSSHSGSAPMDLGAMDKRKSGNTKVKCYHGGQREHKPKSIKLKEHLAGDPPESEN